MTDKITVPRATWNAVREALETCTYTSSYDKSFDIVKVEEALHAANAVSHPQATEQGLVKQKNVVLKRLTKYERKCFDDWKNP